MPHDTTGNYLGIEAYLESLRGSTESLRPHDRIEAGLPGTLYFMRSDMMNGSNPVTIPVVPS